MVTAVTANHGQDAVNLLNVVGPCGWQDLTDKANAGLPNNILLAGAFKQDGDRATFSLIKDQLSGARAFRS